MCDCCKCHKNRKQPKTSNVVLVLLGVFIFLFEVAMFITYWVKGSIPDTLVQYTLGASGLEALLLAGITVSKVFRGESTTEASFSSDASSII